MSDPSDLTTFIEATEIWLVQELNLTPVRLDPVLSYAEGTWKEFPITIDTRAYRGGSIRYARFAVVRGTPLAIGNILCLSHPTYPLPILGADLVALGRETAMIAADLSPTIPAGLERDVQLADLAARRARRPPLPSGGALPDWCADWFSSFALFTRVTPDQQSHALQSFSDFPAAFADLVHRASIRPDLAPRVAMTQEGYTAAHRRDDKGLRMLSKMFGAPWTDRYVREVLFPR